MYNLYVRHTGSLTSFDRQSAAAKPPKSTILCISDECVNQAASSCPNKSCLRHCRLTNARKAGLYPSSSPSSSPKGKERAVAANLPPTDEEAAINTLPASTSGQGAEEDGEEKKEAYEGMGCEFHEEKVRARKELNKARRESTKAIKLEKQKKKREGKALQKEKGKKARKGAQGGIEEEERSNMEMEGVGLEKSSLS